MLDCADGKWKLLCDYDGGRAQLYDLQMDPGETMNVTEEYPEITGQLTQKTLEWWVSVNP